MALAFYQEKDYFGAEKVLEFYLKQGSDAVDNNSAQFIFDLLTKINTLPEDAPANWNPVDLW